MDTEKRPLGPERRMDREPDTRPYETMQPDQSDPPKDPKPPTSQMNRSYRRTKLLSVLLAVALLAAAALAYLAYDLKNSLEQLDNSSQKTIGQQSDELTALRDKVAELESNEGQAVEAPVNDDEEIMRVAREFVCVLYVNGCDQLQLERLGSLYEGENERVTFAQVGYTTPDGQTGSRMTLKNAGGDWVVVAYGQGIPVEAREAFNIPQLPADSH